MASEKVTVDSSENKAMEQKNEERRCYVCYSCPRVEKSQSILCQEEGENQCMVCVVGHLATLNFMGACSL